MLLGAFQEVAGIFAGSSWRSCWEPLEKLLDASREVAGNFKRSFWDLLEKSLATSGEVAGSLEKLLESS
jgi:hypothetical protein